MDNYTMRTFEQQFEKCKAQLVALGYGEELNRKQYQLYFMEKNNVLGLCHRCSEDKYTISMNFKYASMCEEHDIIDTVMHELIHSLDGCMKHTGRWKEITNKVNTLLGYNIHRTTATEEYGGYIREQKEQSYRYEIKCNCCGALSRYMKRTKVVTNISNHTGRYSCNKCHSINDFTVTNLI